ncbi:MAG TPA: zinc-ribbon domain-containing protein [Terriglobia bacterium]
MAFCAKCGAELNTGSAFCPSCGAPAGGAPAGAAPLTSNAAGALAYLLGFITGIIFLVIEPYKRDPFVRFHAFQSIFLNVVVFAVFVLWGAVSGTLFFVSLGFLWSLVALVWVLLRLAFFVLWLFLMYKAYNNERFMVPFIGPLAAKQASP